MSLFTNIFIKKKKKQKLPRCENIARTRGEQERRTRAFRGLDAKIFFKNCASAAPFASTLRHQTYAIVSKWTNNEQFIKFCFLTIPQSRNFPRPSIFTLCIFSHNDTAISIRPAAVAREKKTFFSFRRTLLYNARETLLALFIIDDDDDDDTRPREDRGENRERKFPGEMTKLFSGRASGAQIGGRA